MSNAAFNKYLLLGSLSIFLIITGPSLFSEGMFLDGLMYAGIADNLANGSGSFWNLFYTKTLYTQFNEHPPLVFGLQALFFKLFGSGIWVERLYSLCTFLAISFLTIQLWKLISGSYRHSWVLVLFFATIPLMTWSTANNMLENTMSIFTISSAYFYFLGQKKEQNFYFLVSGVMLFLAFLSKGFTGLFVWTLPFVYYLFGLRKPETKMISSALVVVGTLIIAGITFLVIPESLAVVVRYFNRQVKGSLENVQTVSNRFYIVGKIVTELLIPIGMLLLLHVILRLKKINWGKNELFRAGISFIAVGLSGVLPIVISLKQSGFYVVCTFPFFVVGLVALFKGQLDLLDALLRKVVKEGKWLKRVVITLISLMLLTAIISGQRVGRDEERIAMVKQVMLYVDQEEILKVNPSMMKDWGLHAYFCRYTGISLSDQELDQKYILTEKASNDKLVLQSGRYFLYRIQK